LENPPSVNVDVPEYLEAKKSRASTPAPTRRGGCEWANKA